VLLRFFPRKAKHLLEDHRDIGHKVDWVIVHDDLPGEVEFFGRASLLLDGRIFH
jgi:hypothetical protein